MIQREAIDIFGSEFIANPYPTYDYLRQYEPVYHTVAPNGWDMYIVSRYSDVWALLKDDRFIKDRASLLTPDQLSNQPPIPDALKPLAQTILDMDGADHARLRALIHKAFTPHLVEAMKPRIQEICDNLLDAVQNKGEMDLISAYAFALPITVIAEILGVPVEDQDKFRQWSTDSRQRRLW